MVAPVQTTPPNSGPEAAANRMESPFGQAPKHVESETVRSRRTTPGWYRTMAVITVVLTLIFAGVATAAALVTRSSSQRLENNTAPSLIAVQDLSSSVAEANAAATAAFLSGQNGIEDRGRRNLYTDALTRSSRQTEKVASLIGNDEESHVQLGNVASALVTYSGQVETARTQSQLSQQSASGTEETAPDGAQEEETDESGTDEEVDEEEADEVTVEGASQEAASARQLQASRTLEAALASNRTQIAPSLDIVTVRAQNGFDRDSSEGFLLGVGAVAVGLVALLFLLWLQIGMAKRSRRVFNLFLLLATVALLGTLVVLSRGLIVRQVALSNAESGGYDSIVATSDLQSSVFELQSELGLSLLGSGNPNTAELLDQIDQDVSRIRARADRDNSIRETAAVDQLEARLERYKTSVREISETSESNREASIELFEGEGLANFNGVNTSIESVVSDNRSQFNSGVAAASDALWFLPFATIILPILAALGTILGIQRRLGEYQ